MLHALSGLYALTGEGSYAAGFKAILPAYVDYARKVAAGVAHALEAVANHQRGVAVLKLGASVDQKTVRDHLVAKPWRRAFIQVSDQLPADALQLCLGTECQAPTNKIGEALAKF
jgi:hypothetical protein